MAGMLFHIQGKEDFLSSGKSIPVLTKKLLVIGNRESLIRKKTQVFPDREMG